MHADFVKIADFHNVMLMMLIPAQQLVSHHCHNDIDLQELKTQVGISTGLN